MNQIEDGCICYTKNLQLVVTYYAWHHVAIEYHRGMDIAIAASDEREERATKVGRGTFYYLFIFIDFLYVVDQVKVSSERMNNV